MLAINIRNNCENNKISIFKIIFYMSQLINIVIIYIYQHDIIFHKNLIR